MHLQAGEGKAHQSYESFSVRYTSNLLKKCARVHTSAYGISWPIKEVSQDFIAP